jgi:arylsulfatase A-like enzyme
MLTFDGAAPRNIVLFVVDTLRADRVTDYSVADGQTSYLSSLSDHTVVFDNVQAASVWTGSTTASLLTSRRPLHHDVLYLAGAEGSYVSGETWQGRLSASGWQTLQFSANAHASTLHGLSDTFDVSHTADDSRARSLVYDALSGLASRDDKSAPFFLHIQPRDPHQAYSPPPDLRGILENDPNVPVLTDAQRAWIAEQADLPPDERAAAGDTLRALYGEEVLEVNRALPLLIDGLDAAHVLDDTLIVFTADHGEELADDPAGFVFGHGITRPAVLHLPLVVWNPRLVPRHEPALVAQTDIVPTVLTALGVPFDDTGLDGGDRGARPRATATSEYLSSSPDDDASLRVFSITDGSLRVLWACDGTVTVFDRLADPDEIDALAVGNVPGASDLLDTLEAQVRDELADSPLDIPCAEP